MTPCKHCGAELPENAKFCLQCGAPVDPVEPEQPEVPPPTPRQPQGPLPELDFFQPALTGGMFLGLLSSVPILSAGNCLCCMWVLLGGAIATVLLTRQRPINLLTYGDGAFAGVLSGVIGAAVGTIVQMSFRAIASQFFESQQQQVEELLNRVGAEGPFRDWAMRMASGEVSIGTVAITFVSNLLVFALFAMIGGILAVAILNKRQAQGRTAGL